MKKSVRLIATLMVAMLMVVATGKNVSAETYTWTAVKTPGTTQHGTSEVDIPLYKGKMTFKVTSLSGDCSYLLGKVTSSNNSYYYVNTSEKSVMITEVGGEQSFYMSFTTVGNTMDVMTLICSVEKTITERFEYYS